MNNIEKLKSLNRKMHNAVDLQKGYEISKQIDDLYKNEILIYDKSVDVLEIRLHDYPYEVDLEQVLNQHDLVVWIHHLTEKNWVDCDLINAFIERVYEIKKWVLHP
jgi:hypothetical protein